MGQPERDEAAEKYAAEQERVLRQALTDDGYELLEELAKWDTRIKELKGER